MGQEGEREEIEMKRTHLFMPHFFSDKAAKFFSEEFDSGDKFDIILLKNSRLNAEQSSIIEWSRIYEYSNYKECYYAVKEILHDYDQVYMHSSFLQVPVKLLLLAFCKKEISKFVWVEWGYDLYLTSSKQPIDLIKTVIKRWILKYFELKIPDFVGIHPADCTYYKDVLKAKGNVYFAPYAFGKGHDNYLANYKKKSLEEKVRSGEPFVIQICHRPEPDFNLIQILDKISSYKNENIKILIPRGYGDQCYADKVEKHAISVFGNEKVYSLRDFVPRDEYIRILDSTDVLLINSTRQIALGSIHAMFYMQKKVFLPQDSILIPFFKEQGINIHDIGSIGRISFSELTKDEDLSAEREFIMKFNGMDSVQLWKKVFNSIN